MGKRDRKSPASHSNKADPQRGGQTAHTAHRFLAGRVGVEASIFHPGIHHTWVCLGRGLACGHDSTANIAAFLVGMWASGAAACCDVCGGCVVELEAYDAF